MQRLYCKYCRGAIDRAPTNDAIRTTNANSLLIALLIMGIIAFLGLGINTLIVKQIGVEHDVIASGKAYYAAEAAIEQALWEVENNLPGYQRTKESNRKPFIKDEENLKYDYAILSQNLSTPCNFKKLGSEVPADLKWEKLALNQSTTIPLYKVNEAGEKVDVREFTVVFFVNRSDSPIHPQGDVLRWKLIGQKNDGSFETEAISEYIPVYKNSTTPYPIDSTKETNQYTEFGTQTDSAVPETYTHAKYYHREGETYTFTAKQPIKDFFANHTNLTLVLTNIINPVDQGPYNTPEENILWFYVKTPNSPGETLSESQVCTVSHLTANGYSSNLKQSIDIDIKLDSFLPVFDFALYRTKTE